MTAHPEGSRCMRLRTATCMSTRRSNRVYVGHNGAWTLSKFRNVFQEGRNRAIVETRLRADGSLEVLVTREEGVVHVVTDGAAKLEELS